MRLAPVFVVAWSAFLFLYGINSAPLYRTESLRAIIGRECLHGHWLYPVLYGEPFLTKPPGHYAAIGLCSMLFGEVSAASARLPSVFAALAAVVLMHGMFRRVLGERAAFLIAVLLPCSVLWLDKVPSAEIDMTLVGWVTAAIVFFHRGLESQRHPLGFLALSLLCVAVGTLTKWTAPAFFYLTVVPLLTWRRQLAFLFGWRHLLAVSVAAGVCVCWGCAVAQQVGWEALTDTIRKEAGYRLAPKAGRGYPWGDVALYPLMVFAAHLPVSAFALLTFRRSFWANWDERGKLLLQLLHCWTWPNLLFWTLVPNHNVRYALPMSAGLMGLGVMGLVGWLANPARKGGGWRTRSKDTDPAPLASLAAPPLKREGLKAEDHSTPRTEEGATLAPPSFPGKGAGGGRLPSPPSALGKGAGGIRFLFLFLLCWAVAKVAFVEMVLPQRTAGRNAEATAAELRERIPAGQPLYVFRLKDEGVTFYYAQLVVKLNDPRMLPPGAFALLIRQEWKDRAAFGHFKLICCMNDQQGDPMYLVCNP